ncbi:TPA: Eaa protein [Salmonella enterica]|nr:Eaa protein [Salmonella enterica]
MSNNKLTDRKIAEILARAEICDDSVLTDYTDIAAAMRELQERRRLDGIQHAVCEVCGVPCNNPNHPQMAVAHEYSAQPVPVVPDDGRAEFEACMLKKWGRERQEYDFAMGKFLHGENYADSYTRHMWKAWTESRVALLQSKYRDLSQPVDHQISEYEKIMGQAGNSPVIPGVYLVDINTDHQH